VAVWLHLCFIHFEASFYLSSWTRTRAQGSAPVKPPSVAVRSKIPYSRKGDGALTALISSVRERAFRMSGVSVVANPLSGSTVARSGTWLR
jgi:hypothetical protein